MCGPVPLSHKFPRVYSNLDKKILTTEEAGSWVGYKWKWELQRRKE